MTVTPPVPEMAQSLAWDKYPLSEPLEPILTTGKPFTSEFLFSTLPPPVVMSFAPDPESVHTAPLNMSAV
jgi:hypothetical protein